RAECLRLVRNYTRALWPRRDKTIRTKMMNAMVMGYGALFVAILCEVAGTSLLQQSQQFTKLVPTVLMALCYAAAFYLLTHALKIMPVGVAYAIWAGFGIVLISAVG